MIVVNNDTTDTNWTMLLKISEPGCFHAIASYDGTELKNGVINIISLTGTKLTLILRRRELINYTIAR